MSPEGWHKRTPIFPDLASLRDARGPPTKGVRFCCCCSRGVRSSNDVMCRCVLTLVKFIRSIPCSLSVLMLIDDFSSAAETKYVITSSTSTTCLSLRSTPSPYYTRTRCHVIVILGERHRARSMFSSTDFQRPFASTPTFDVAPRKLTAFAFC